MYVAAQKWLCRFGLGIALLVLSGCGAVQTATDFKPPEVKLVEVVLLKARLLEQRFLLKFRIENPNPYVLPVRGMVYDVHLQDVQLSTGETSQRVEIPAFASGDYEVPVRANLWQHSDFVAEYLDKPGKVVTYRLSGTLKTRFLLNRNVPVFNRGLVVPTRDSKD